MRCDEASLVSEDNGLCAITQAQFGANLIGELASFALLTVALSQVTRLLLQPADTPGKITAQGAAAPEPQDATPARPA